MRVVPLFSYVLVYSFLVSSELHRHCSSLLSAADGLTDLRRLNTFPDNGFHVDDRFSYFAY